MKKRTSALIAAGAVTALALTGCSADAGSAETLENGDKSTLDIAVFNGWDEGVAVSELWKAVLEEQGYTVNLEYADAAPVFSGLSSGDYDLTMDVWLPVTHESYIEEYGDDIVDLGAWNEESKLAIAVNEDAPIDSLSDLAENADLFGNRIVGIEPGAGLTKATTEQVIPTYGLDGMEYLTSSTAAMLTELTAATKNGENIVVTLWEPHWAYGAFPLKNLEDPEGTLGGTESLHSYARDGFAEEYPTLAGWLKNFEMDLDTLYSLETAMFVDNDTDDYGPIIEKWISENQEYVDSLTS
ncbi:glycine betaine ABC transporter substrate-binding protein [Diaminobutyricimonas sp. TR449]|uniref:glycine betaine ABC transporter substrate-binding protein n=1 Tax=Diaminobutyricimonas sp. TR449 TaxID=2708076 RepID=UPI001422BF23|nr:glycine betaine ABC transporter substrate-binding protein [Diaminobutyricimonas sp. TR449]